MELPHIGQHCSLKECNQLDFLPVKCDACDKVFCVNHYRYDSHKCDKAESKNVQVPVCPLCMKPVGIKRDQLPDVAISEHIDKYCIRNDLIKNVPVSSTAGTNLQKCSFKSCKQKDVIYLECRDCKTKFCVRHRHPSDHKCTGPRAQTLGSNLAENWNHFRGSCSNSASSGLDKLKIRAQQISKSGQTVLNRVMASHSSDTQPSRVRQAVTNLQGTLSEQEALAIALNESNRTTSGQSIDESQDAALARAIYESEVEAQQRRSGNHDQKSTCVLS